MNNLDALARQLSTQLGCSEKLAAMSLELLRLHGAATADSRELANSDDDMGNPDFAAAVIDTEYLLLALEQGIETLHAAHCGGWQAEVAA